MKKATWKKKITDACREAGTYRDCFDAVIDTLAEMLERRDGLQEAYEQRGSVPIIPHTNKSGATNFEQNPLLRMINDLNRDALAYWRDLGLTPAGLKRIDENRMKNQENKKSFEDVLSGLGL